MKKMNFFAVLLLGAAVLFSACNASNTVKGTGIGAVSGGALGAGVGAWIGKSSGNAGKGAAIGAGVGAVAGAGTGAIIGAKMDKQKKELEAIQNAQVETINDGQAIRVIFDSGILFAKNSNTLSDASTTALSQFAASLKANPDTDVKIAGHTDSSGTRDYNMELSLKRANSVKDFLMKQGIASGRMETKGFGPDEPVAQNDAKGNQPLNRRVEVFILPNAKMISDAEKEAAGK